MTDEKKNEVIYDVIFYSLHTMKNEGTFSHEGSEEEAKEALVNDLTESLGKDNFKIVSFSESKQLELPLIDKKDLN